MAGQGPLKHLKEPCVYKIEYQTHDGSSDEDNPKGDVGTLLQSLFKDLVDRRRRPMVVISVIFPCFRW